MVKKEYSNSRDLTPNNFHRTLGRKILMIDVDCLEFQFKDGDIEHVAVIDYKHPNVKKLSKHDVSTRCQAHLANKLNIPFFICITYLDPDEYDVPMMYVIAANDIAKNMFENHKFWLSAYGFSTFQHWLRGLKIDLEKEPELAYLSKEKIEYELPLMDM